MMGKISPTSYGIIFDWISECAYRHLEDNDRDKIVYNITAICVLWVENWNWTIFEKSSEGFLTVFPAESCAGWWVENFALLFDPWLPRKDNVKVKKLLKIIHFLKFFKIFSLKLFLIIKGNIIPGFSLQIRA